MTKTSLVRDDNELCSSHRVSRVMKEEEKPQWREVGNEDRGRGDGDDEARNGWTRLSRVGGDIDGGLKNTDVVRR